MRGLLVLLGASLTFGMLSLPVQAKGPQRITVEGPGIEGEVDLLESTRTANVRAFVLPTELLGDPLPQAPGGDGGEAYVLTWYGVLGASHGDSPQPLLSRVAYYPEMRLAKALDGIESELAGGGSGWYQVNAQAAASFSKTLEKIDQKDQVGAAGYVFESAGTGRGADAEWVAQPLATTGKDRSVGDGYYSPGEPLNASTGRMMAVTGTAAITLAIAFFLVLTRGSARTEDEVRVGDQIS